MIGKYEHPFSFKFIIFEGSFISSLAAVVVRKYKFALAMHSFVYEITDIVSPVGPSAFTYSVESAMSHISSKRKDPA